MGMVSVTLGTNIVASTTQKWESLAPSGHVPTLSMMEGSNLIVHSMSTLVLEVMHLRGRVQFMERLLPLFSQMGRSTTMCVLFMRTGVQLLTVYVSFLMH